MLETVGKNVLHRLITSFTFLYPLTFSPLPPFMRFALSLYPLTTERNLAEFAAEDYNWRSACQEEEMYICEDTRELIHPVHIELGRYTFGTGGSCHKSYGYE